MSGATDGEAILKEMVDGLKAVSEGPWESDWDGTKNDTEGHYASYKLMDGSGYTIADALNATATDIIAECSADGHVIDRLAAANFEHFARCDPENIRAIAAYASTLKSERDAALERVAVLENKTVKQLADALRLHHEHALNGGTIFVKDDEGGYHEVDLTDAYSESGLCDQTVAALKEQS